MADVTQQILSYRESARSLWNHFLRPGVEPYVDFDTIDAFSEICELLFDALVLRLIAKSGFKKGSAADPFPFLRMRPSVEPLPIMISRPSKEGRYWDDPVNRLGVKGLSLLFVDFFDWDRFGYIDLQYYRVKIAKCDEHPHVVGREALLDVHHAGVEFEEPGPG
jgi:hypothetical protein